jgi:hypothetical protein
MPDPRGNLKIPVNQGAELPHGPKRNTHGILSQEIRYNIYKLIQ